MRETIVGKTKAGTKVGYRVKDGDAMYTIYFVGGGQLPANLEGMWTDERQATIAIGKYLNKDKLCAPDQKIKTEKKNLRESKKRPSRLKQKVG